jgi:hypothetical protein
MVTEIYFTGIKPTPYQLERLNRAIKALDYDAPTLTEQGMPRSEWRDPHYLLQTILAFLVRQGFPCSGFQASSSSFYGDGPADFVKLVGEEMPNLPEMAVWDEAYWNNASAEQRKLEADMNNYCKISNSLENSILALQSVAGIITATSNDADSVGKLIKNINVLSGVRDIYIKKHDDTVNVLREMENGKTD